MPGSGAVTQIDAMSKRAAPDTVPPSPKKNQKKLSTKAKGMHIAEAEEVMIMQLFHVKLEDDWNVIESKAGAHIP